MKKTVFLPWAALAGVIVAVVMIFVYAPTEAVQGHSEGWVYFLSRLAAVATGLAIPLLGEVPALGDLAGAVVVVAGLVLATRPAKTAEI